MNMKPMNVGAWVTPSAMSRAIRARGGQSVRPHREHRIGVIIERTWCTFSAEWSYTIMWSNADIEKQWVRRGLRYARFGDGVTPETVEATCDAWDEWETAQQETENTRVVSAEEWEDIVL